MGRSHLQSQRAGAILPRKGRRRLRGYTTYIDHTGLIHVVAKPRSRTLPPLMPFVVLAALVIAFKALAMVNVGLGTYQDKVATLQAGTAVEQAIGFVLREDPASSWLYSTIKPLFSQG